MMINKHVKDDLDALLASLDEPSERMTYEISYPIHRLGRPTPEVAEIIFELSRTGDVSVLTEHYMHDNELHIRVDAGKETVRRVVRDKSKIQEELLAALVSIQLGK